MSRPSRLFWLWARLLTAILVVVCLLAFVLFALLAIRHNDNLTFHWLTAITVILIWIVGTCIHPWVTTKQQQSQEPTTSKQ